MEIIKINGDKVRTAVALILSTPGGGDLGSRRYTPLPLCHA
jgi:ClpP class serine protease